MNMIDSFSQMDPTLFGGLAIAAFVLLVGMLFTGRTSRTQQRLEELSAAPASAPAAPNLRRESVSRQAGQNVDEQLAARQKEEQEKKEFKARLVQAGLYRANAAAVFAIAKLGMLAGMTGLGLLISIAGWMPLPLALLLGVCLGLGGTIAPSFWLDHVKRTRQIQIRRSLPDALDVMGVCMAGGLSLPGALSRVAKELHTAHPMLAAEFVIMEREIQMGHSNGEAFREFADRFDMEELRSLAAVVGQAEKFGGSVVRALEVYAETMRRKRHQRAEELAQKASVKILFPTLLCIFPGIFIVILGPAAMQIYTMLLSRGPGQ